MRKSFITDRKLSIIKVEDINWEWNRESAKRRDRVPRIERTGEAKAILLRGLPVTVLTARR